MLLARAEAGRPVTVALIGAGKFGTMFLAQARLTRGLHVVAVADRDIPRARAQLRSAGWADDAFSAPSLDDAYARGATHLTDDANAAIADPRIEVIVEATGVPEAGIRHARGAIAHGKHIVMVNVEADAVAGPLLAREARSAGTVYSLAWGDQPALICEHVDWARTCGFRVVAAGKGTRYEPHYHRSTPDTVWDILDKYLHIADRNSINPKMFNSFVDGSKSAIEMTAVCNATGLVPQTEGLGFPPASRFELADVCKPLAAGGTLEKAGVTEVVSSVTRDGRDVPHHLALGTYVVIEGETDYARRCFAEYACCRTGAAAMRRCTGRFT
jgi:predicted homoserine dehydrogenase-like protein